MGAAGSHDHDALAGEFLDEHIEHADERWLMSYADMMTLLFGLFVMLYSMYDQFPVIQESAGLKFSSSKEVGGSQEDAAIARQIEDNAVEKVKIENETLRVKVEALETQLTAEKAKVAEANAMMEVIKVKAETVVPTANVTALEKEIADLRVKLSQSESEILSLQSQKTHNRNIDNRPQADESQTELRADGLGGHGGGGMGKKPMGGGGQGQGRRPSYELDITLPDGRIVSKKTKGAGPNGLQLDEPLDIGPGRKVTVKIKKDGRSVEVRAKTLEGDDGSNSPRLRFLDFPNGDQSVYKGWLEESNAPTP